MALPSDAAVGDGQLQMESLLQGPSERGGGREGVGQGSSDEFRAGSPQQALGGLAGEDDAVVGVDQEDRFLQVFDELLSAAVLLAEQGQLTLDDGELLG